MVFSWLKTAIIYVVSIAVVAVLGTWLGTMYGSYRAEAEQARKKAAYQGFLEKNIVGINLGLPFPDIAVEAPGNHETYSIRELLPQGGLLIYLSMGCESCLRTIETIGRTLRETEMDAGSVLLISFENPQEMSDTLSQMGFNVPIYYDFEIALARDFKVSTLPTTFLLDENGIVRQMVAGMDSPSEIMQMLEE